MTVFRSLVLLFVVVPLLELYILIHVGGLIGVLPTIGICILTAVLGASLLRYQGLQTIARVQTKLSQGEVPATDMLEGVILLLCGFLLLTPGFFTDVIGFLCLIPPFRTFMATRILSQLLVKSTSSSNVNHTVIIEGEFWNEENKRLKE